MTGLMMALQRDVQDMQDSDTHVISVSTQIEDISDNLQETPVRIGKLNQRLSEAHNVIQGIDAKLSTRTPALLSVIETPDVRSLAGSESSLLRAAGWAASMPLRDVLGLRASISAIS